MILKEWDDLPEFMKNDEVKEYYGILSKKKISLLMKRLFDIVMSLILLVLLSPLFLILAIWIKFDSIGPVFYRQERITQYGRIFRIFKFRTMVVDADKKGVLVTTQGDTRITKVGKKIRRCRLDEIPQLLNIFHGDMSFVGTRPEVKKYVDAYTNEMYATLLLPAGVTSLASIEFKDEDAIISENLNGKQTIDEIYTINVLSLKMQYNLDYLKNFSFLNDIKICFFTVIEVII